MLTRALCSISKVVRLWLDSAKSRALEKTGSRRLKNAGGSSSAFSKRSLLAEVLPNDASAISTVSCPSNPKKPKSAQHPGSPRSLNAKNSKQEDWAFNSIAEIAPNKIAMNNGPLIRSMEAKQSMTQETRDEHEPCKLPQRQPIPPSPHEVETLSQYIWPNARDSVWVDGGILRLKPPPDPLRESRGAARCIHRAPLGPISLLLG